MLGSDELSDLLSLAYATATRQSNWQSFCDELSRVTMESVMMFGHNLERDVGLGLIASGLDPAELERYHVGFADKNPWMHMNMTLPVGTVGVSDHALPRKELFKTAFYNDWLRLQENIVAGPCMMCFRSADGFVGMAAACRSRKIDETLPHSHGLFSVLAPHVTRAIEMSAVLSQDGEASFAHLQVSRHAVIMLRRSGRMGFANPPALQFLSDSNVLTATSSETVVGVGQQTNAWVSCATKAIKNAVIEALPAPLVVHPKVFGPVS